MLASQYEFYLYTYIHSHFARLVVSSSNFGQAASHRVLGLVDSSLNFGDLACPTQTNAQSRRCTEKGSENYMEKKTDPVLCVSAAASQTMLWSTYPHHKR